MHQTQDGDYLTNTPPPAGEYEGGDLLAVHKDKAAHGNADHDHDLNHQVHGSPQAILIPPQPRESTIEDR